jgi:hypothetical protein
VEAEPSAEPIQEPPERRSAWIVAMVCAAMLLAFAVISYSAGRTKSPVFDEPLHLVGGFIHRTAGDFRINPEDPPLLGFFASLLIGRDEIKVDYSSKFWPAMLENFNLNQWEFIMRTLFQTPSVRGDDLVQRARILFVVLGAMLGAVIGFWSWRIGGAAAAIIATAFFALDPNFTGHAALIKNDVPFALFFAILIMVVWSFGQRGTWLNLTVASFACAAAVNVKLTGMLCGPIVAALLFTRAILPQSWPVLRFTLNSRGQRLIAAAGACAVIGLVSYIGIWACYGFRFGPTPDPQSRMNTNAFVWDAKANHLHNRLPPDVQLTPAMIAAEPAGLPILATSFAESHHLLPQAWINGFDYTYATTLARWSYLMGQIRKNGFWYYFPCAMLFKTPTATLLAIPMSVAAIVWVLVTGKNPLTFSPNCGWSFACLTIPPLVYLGSAMTTNMNVGLRHVLPIYPFIFIALGSIFSLVIARSKLIGTVLSAVMLLGLAGESLAAWPDYIAFFNAPSDAVAGRLHLLGDSNLDWGQDLKLLAAWQKKHPFERLYLSYFGIPDPAAYGVTATHLFGGWPFTDSHPLPSGERCYLAVSATNLQGIYFPPEMRDQYAPLVHYPPMEVLGHTIYIFEYPIDRTKLNTR